VSNHWQAGYVVAERYELQEIIGSGGMGDVWRAQHLKLRSPVAIKVLRGAFSDDTDASTRFLREAQAAAALRSTNVVQVLDYGVDEGIAYIAMEYLEGESLCDRLRSVGRLSTEDTARVLTQVARAVSRAHRKGIVHRDLKPGNIQLVPEDGDEVVKVLDFGIAKVREDLALGSDESTRSGAMLGTPFYMSPEQLRGVRSIDARTDLFALGVIVYECLVGKRPFTGETLGDLVLTICTEEHPTPSEHAEVPDGFDDWFAKATMVDPDGRFDDAQEMFQHLREILLGETAPQSRAVVAGFDMSEGHAVAPAVHDKPSSRPPASASAEPLGNTSMAQARTLSSSRPPSSVQAVGGGRGMLGIGLMAVAAAALFIALRSGGESAPAAAPIEQPIEQPSATAAPDTTTTSQPAAVATTNVTATASASASTSASATTAPSVAPPKTVAPPRGRLPPAPKASTAPKKIEFGF
jgi:serine/threonine protein kinase